MKDIVPQILQADGYNPQALELLVNAAAWAYSSPNIYASILSRLGMENDLVHITVVNDAMFIDATAYFNWSPCRKLGVLCFRGTRPFQIGDWLTDTSVQPVSFPKYGRVHGGFYRNLMAIWDEIARVIQNAVSELEALYITGHSLGAAMAVLATAMIYSDSAYEPIREVHRGTYTFGQPMVGSPEFADSCRPIFGDYVFRHVYGHDIVTRFPPRITGNFEHFGSEYVPLGDGWHGIKPTSSQLNTVLLSNVLGVSAYLFEQFPLLDRIKMPVSWGDHSPVRYLSVGSKSVLMLRPKSK